uniref:Uncharacterized protein n=1 Tax=Anopheles melas TaxID=34690 RepID=A0A182TLK0_9DIPT
MAEQLEPAREPLITLIARERPLPGVRAHMLAVRKLAAEGALADFARNRRFLPLARAAARSYPVLVVLVRTADVARVRAPLKRIDLVLIADAALAKAAGILVSMVVVMLLLLLLLCVKQPASNIFHIASTTTAPVRQQHSAAGSNDGSRGNGRQGYSGRSASARKRRSIRTAAVQHHVGAHVQHQPRLAGKRSPAQQTGIFHPAPFGPRFDRSGGARCWSSIERSCDARGVSFAGTSSFACWTGGDGVLVALGGSCLVVRR